ncbi:MAG TPA: hypothetical protein VMB79_12600 [Jatrophihabitans sp.]|nr:hypothetical protein [Jatrophihabitans sp.]
MVLFSISRHPFWQVLATSAMFAAASMAAGGLLGLLFGVPRSMATGQQGTPGLAGIAANTNLEQISDWLTKIIVGVTLTQLVTIKKGAAHLFGAMAPMLGGPPDGSAFAGAIVVYFSVLGFFAGWLYARLRLGVAMSSADALLVLSQRASKAGDDNTAAVAKAQAAAIIGAAATPSVATPGAAAPGTATGPDGATADRPVTALSLAASYNQLRATLATGTSRTARLEDIIRQARRLGAGHTFTVQDVRSMFLTGDPGSRVVALGIMQGDPTCGDPSTVESAISRPMSAFEQYHALVVGSQLAATLDADGRAQLAAAVNTAMNDATYPLQAGMSRYDVARQILDSIDRLDQADAGGAQPAAQDPGQQAAAQQAAGQQDAGQQNAGQEAAGPEAEDGQASRPTDGG